MKSRVDEDGFEVVDETPEFQATVDMEVQAKVDSKPSRRAGRGSPDHLFGKTLEQEERIEAQEAELEHISARLNSVSRRGRARSGREISQRSGALSGVWSSEAGGERESDG